MFPALPLAEKFTTLMHDPNVSVVDLLLSMVNFIGVYLEKESGKGIHPDLEKYNLTLSFTPPNRVCTPLVL